MKENQDNENDELIMNEIEENEPQKVNKEIRLNIFNYEQNKFENFKLLNEEEELLLCKEDLLNQIKSKKDDIGENITIKELFNGEDNDSLYYLNKNNLRVKYLKIEENINEDNEDINSLLDNQNEQEMEKVYKESLLKHPRRIIDGKIKKYNFFNWSGFFCCNKRDYLNLGQAYITYFNTIKLLILVFTIMTIIHLALLNLNLDFTSAYNFDNDRLLKTTLGNTIFTYFNTSYFFLRETNILMIIIKILKSILIVEKITYMIL